MKGTNEREPIMEVEIKTLNDMLKVPTEKFDEFLEGFVGAMKAAKAAYDLMVLFTNARGVAVKEGDIVMPRMVWKDDDKKNITINIHAQKASADDRGQKGSG